jgi:hypothetical protein
VALNYFLEELEKKIKRNNAKNKGNEWARKQRYPQARLYISLLSHAPHAQIFTPSHLIHLHDLD